MKYYLFLILTLCNGINLLSQTYTSDQIVGNWISAERDLIVNCYKVNDVFYGKIVWFKNYNDDLHGKNTAVPEDQWINAIVMKHFVFSDNEWKDGEIYDLNSGKSYTSLIVLNDANTLSCTGYVWLPIFGQTMRFTRYQEAKLPAF